MGVEASRVFYNNPHKVYSFTKFTKNSDKHIDNKVETLNNIHVQYCNNELNSELLNITDSLICNVNKMNLSEKIEYTAGVNYNQSERKNVHTNPNDLLTTEELFTMLQDKSYAHFLVENKKISNKILKNVLNHFSIDSPSTFKAPYNENEIFYK